jgi:hypothetical protein
MIEGATARGRSIVAEKVTGGITGSTAGSSPRCEHGHGPLTPRIVGSDYQLSGRAMCQDDLCTLSRSCAPRTSRHIWCE